MIDSKATTTFTYKTSGLYALGERFPQKTIKVETHCDDLDAHEMLDLFKDFMVGCGYLEKSFYDACEKATEENPYAKGGDGYELEKSNKTESEIWHSGRFTPHPEKAGETPQIPY